MARPLTLSLTLPFVASLGLALAGCVGDKPAPGPAQLNSAQEDSQPALSGDGRLLAFVSHRNGTSSLLLYDLERQRFLDLSRLNRADSIAEQPSLSYTGRYLVYLASDLGRPEIQLFDRATGQVQIVSQGYRGWVRSPRISPDGRMIVFESSARGQWDLELFDRGPNVALDLPDGLRR